MIITTYDPEHLHRSFGIDLGDVDLGPVEALGVSANFARVPPGRHSDPHQHDETETFVIFSGQGDIVVEGKRTPITTPMVVQFEPFESHYLDNTGDTDIFFTTFYWRDSPRAAKKAPRTDRRRFGDRPVFVFSTPPTPNGGLHIGHLCGPYLGTDAFVRFQRMNGANVYHLAATDDFQSYVAECARREGRSPAEVAEFYATEISEALAAMDIHPDQVIHTSREPGYPQALQAFFARLVDSGIVTKAEGAALFDGDTGQYLYEPYVGGGCPGCGNETGGNICEICGEPNFCVDLVDPQPTIGTATPRQGTIVRYTLPLHELRVDLLEHHAVGRAPAKVKRAGEPVAPAETGSTWRSPTLRTGASGQPRATCPVRSSGSGSSWRSASSTGSKRSAASLARAGVRARRRTTGRSSISLATTTRSTTRSSAQPCTRSPAQAGPPTSTTTSTSSTCSTATSSRPAAGT